MRIKTQQVFAAFAFIVVLAAGASEASAQIGFQGGGGFGLGFYNYGQQNNGPRIPYYALYPPVYYSAPVPRTYGYSPFAYPPGTLTPELPSPGAAQFRNPSVPQPTKATSDMTAESTPRLYLNPFVKQDTTSKLVSGKAAK